MKNILSLFLFCASSLALGAGGPTAGKAPVPENHILVHEFMGAGGLYTEIFTKVFVKDEFTTAYVVTRTNDGSSATEKTSVHQLATKTPCDAEGGRMRTMEANKDPVDSAWSRVVPNRWDDTPQNRRRTYAVTELVKDVIGTEMCLQAHRPFANYLLAEVQENGPKLSASVEAAYARDRAIRDRELAECKARFDQLQSERAQIEADGARLEKRVDDNNFYRESLDRRLALLEATTGNYANIRSNMIAQYEADRTDFNRRLRTVKTDIAAHERRAERRNERSDAYNSECVK